MADNRESFYRHFIDSLPNSPLTGKVLQAVGILALVLFGASACSREATVTTHTPDTPDPYSCATIVLEPNDSPTDIGVCKINYTDAGPAIRLEGNAKYPGINFNHPDGTNRVFVNSTYPGVSVSYAFWTDLLHQQGVIGGDVAGTLLFEQSNTTTIIINGIDVTFDTSGQLSLEIGDCDGMSCIVLPGGQKITYEYLAGQIARFAGKDPDLIPRTSTTAYLKPETLAMFPLHVEPTPYPSWEPPIVTPIPDWTTTTSDTTLVSPTPVVAVEELTPPTVEVVVPPVQDVFLFIEPNPDKPTLVKAFTPNPYFTEDPPSLAVFKQIINLTDPSPRAITEALDVMKKETKFAQIREVKAKGVDLLGIGLPSDHPHFLQTEILFSQIDIIMINLKANGASFVGTDLITKQIVTFDLNSKQIEKILDANPHAFMLGSKESKINEPATTIFQSIFHSSNTFVSGRIIDPRYLTKAIDHGSSDIAWSAKWVYPTVPGGYVMDKTKFSVKSCLLPTSLPVNVTGMVCSEGECYYMATWNGWQDINQFDPAIIDELKAIVSQFGQRGLEGTINLLIPVGAFTTDHVEYQIAQ
jgi:hypothetical protein